MTRGKRKINLNNLLEKWRSLPFLLSNPDKRLLNRTQKYILTAFSDEHEFIIQFSRLREIFQSVDIHPFDSGNDEEIEKWHKARKDMIELLETIEKNMKS